jgi:hypothetical protein
VIGGGTEIGEAGEHADRDQPDEEPKQAFEKRALVKIIA